jgi:hypothetical protein
MKTIADASPLIYFSKINSLGLLPKLFEPPGIPPVVYQEIVVSGLAHGFPDAERIKAAFQQGLLILRPESTQCCRLARCSNMAACGCAFTGLHSPSSFLGSIPPITPGIGAHNQYAFARLDGTRSPGP